MKPAKVVVKTERDTESSLKIKQEPVSNQNVNSMANSNSRSHADTWGREKQSLIDKIVKLKSENQKILFDLKKSQDDLADMIATNNNLEIELKQIDQNHSMELSQQRSEHSKLNAASETMKIDFEKRISQLTREGDLLRAQLKQLQHGMIQHKTSDESDNRKKNEGDIYEVECLLDDKIVCKKRLYLVHWKGYDSSHDSWVAESNLFCPSILDTYKNSKK